MGRHRPDPRGHARIIVAIAAVALALALLVIGGFALLGALTSGPADTVSSSSSPTATAAQSTPDATAGSTAGTPTVQIRVVGAPTKVYVAVPGSAPSIIRQNGVLGTGEVRKYDDAALDVVVYNGAAVQVTINGVLQRQGASGQTQRWQNVRKS